MENSTDLQGQRSTLTLDDRYIVKITSMLTVLPVICCDSKQQSTKLSPKLTSCFGINLEIPNQSVMLAKTSFSQTNMF